MLAGRGLGRLFHRSINRNVIGSRGVHTEAMLVRDFVARSLYQKDKGYFTSRTVVGSVGGGERGTGEYGLDFGNMLGKREYQEVLQGIYDNGGETWLTPSEIFHPWYARAVARYVLEGLEASGCEGLHVIEVGGGNGTFALGFLDLVREVAPRVYGSIEYELVEVTPSLADKQEQRVCGEHACARVTRADGSRYRPEQGVDEGKRRKKQRGTAGGKQRQQVMICMEVLDNLPHDKVIYRDGKFHEVWAVKREEEGGAHNRWSEELRDVSDPLLKRAMDLWEIPKALGLEETGLMGGLRRLVGGAGGVAFVPTIATLLLDGVAERDCHVIMADFDHLPDGLRGINGPVVQSKEGGKNRVHNSYLSAPEGGCDIFFPTDFSRLSNVYTCLSNGRTATVLKHSQFCSRYAELNKTQCLTGYNPLLEDYSNFSMLLSNWK